MVTRDDVARHAGVSVAVVSYVVNNKNNVKEETRQKVLRAIEELGYNPNMAARSLKTRKTNQIGVLFNNLGNSFETGISLGLEQRARQYDQSLIFQTYIRSEEHKLKSIFSGRTDGIILMGQSLKPETIEHFAKFGVPLYSVLKPVQDHAYVRSIDIDWYDAMLKLVEHLKSLGHHKIGFMANAMHDHYHHVRFLHFRQAMEASGLEFEEHSLLQAGGYLESAYDRMSNRIKANPKLPFTAIVCAGDLMAIGVLSACKDCGLSVPGDLSVAGCENILMTSHTTPTLTTIHYPRKEIGYMAVDTIMGQIHNGDEPTDSTFGFELMIRQSTVKPTG
ncbi:LacI family DNA-binding transcriptional regulator [Paenibacillus allorhizosphaerae]|uniref:Catabolite control protein A n=1 Tax=Paenibacillus allorhizosphaerae TaxID=2849866 RepID=A0ABM8VJ59_9BACL|nr:LacI family DNA-binding transcriptional regulator [Paenibacillus allorhizosphaerae]CAG7645114.1 Catabolite control protein A [Paenibacillus allorhizosphaerae]